MIVWWMATTQQFVLVAPRDSDTLRASTPTITCKSVMQYDTWLQLSSSSWLHQGIMTSCEQPHPQSHANLSCGMMDAYHSSLYRWHQETVTSCEQLHPHSHAHPDCEHNTHLVQRRHWLGCRFRRQVQRPTNDQHLSLRQRTPKPWCMQTRGK